MFRSLVKESEPPLPLLITGIAGVAGYNAFHFFRARYGDRVIGTRRAANWLLRGEGIVACDTHDADGLKRLFDMHQFASVLSCDGTCALKSCELDPPMAWRVNVLGIENLLEVVEATTRLVHLSVDLVFSGSGAGDLNEDDATDPVTVYGKTMEQSEQLVLQERPDACVLRISLPMGVSFNGHAGAIDWIQSRFIKNKPATLYFDEVRTPTYTDCLNFTLSTILANDLCGLFHAGGPRKLSLYEIAQIVNRVGGYRASLLMGCDRSEAGPMPPRAGDVSLDSARLTKMLGFSPFDPWPFTAEFVPTGRDWHQERPVGEKGCPELLQEILYSNPQRASGIVS